jgi:hypothetical protein
VRWLKGTSSRARGVIGSKGNDPCHCRTALGICGWLFCQSLLLAVEGKIMKKPRRYTSKPTPPLSWLESLLLTAFLVVCVIFLVLSFYSP